MRLKAPLVFIVCHCPPACSFWGIKSLCYNDLTFNRHLNGLPLIQLRKCRPVRLLAKKKKIKSKDAKAQTSTILIKRWGPKEVIYSFDVPWAWSKGHWNQWKGMGAGSYTVWERSRDGVTTQHLTQFSWCFIKKSPSLKYIRLPEEFGQPPLKAFNLSFVTFCFFICKSLSPIIIQVHRTWSILLGHQVWFLLSLATTSQADQAVS